jgi:hypothetical protein
VLEGVLLSASTNGIFEPLNWRPAKSVKLLKFYPDRDWRDSLNRPRPTDVLHRGSIDPGCHPSLYVRSKPTGRNLRQRRPFREFAFADQVIKS